MTARRSPTPLRALRVSVVPFLLLGLLFYLNRDHYHSYRTRQHQLQTWQHQQELETRLNRIVEMKFDTEPSLDEWLAAWSRQAEVPCRIADQQPQNLGLQKIYLSLKPMSARDAMQTLARVCQFGWTICPEPSQPLVEVYPSGIVDDPLLVRSYPLPPEWRSAPWQVGALHKYLQTSPDWLQVREGALLCIERHSPQLQIETFLRRLKQAIEQAEQLPADSAAIDPIAWQPILIDDDPAAFDAAVAALKKPISLDLQDVTLPELARELTRVLDHPVVFDLESLRTFNGLFGSAKVSFKVQHAQLSEVLQAIAPHQGLQAEPVASGRAIMIFHRNARPQNNQAICLAYPISDLVTESNAQQDRYELLKAIVNLINSRYWYDLHGTPRINGGFCGPVLVVAQEWSGHRQLQVLLKALREAKSGVPGTIARTQQSPPLPAPIDKALDQPAELKYQDVPLREIASDLQTRFNLQLTFPADNQVFEETKIWCHLPERPLRENLRHLLNAYSLTLAPVQSELRVIDNYEAQKADYETRFEIEVHNLLALQHCGRHVVGGIEVFLEEFDENFRWRDGGGRGKVVRLGDLLILSHQPHELTRARRTLQALQAHIFRSPAEVRVTALHDRSAPLMDHDRILATSADSAWNDELLRRLAAIDTLEVRDAKMLTVLWQLAEKHGLPIAHPGSPWTDVDPLGELTFSATDEPVGDILKRLSARSSKRWLARDGVVQTWDAAIGTPSYETEWLFDVSDLLQPGGPLLPGQLYRTLNQQAFLSPDKYREASLRLYLGRFLAVHAAGLKCEKMRWTLHALRTGDLQPVPAQEGDAKEAPLDPQRWEFDLDFRSRKKNAPEVLEREEQP